MKEAHESGYPVARHPILEFPTDSKLLELHHEEFLLGSHLLVAPVQDSNVDRLKVYLPILPSGQEAWRHVWSGIIFEGGGDVRVNAPIGRPPVFLRLSDASNPSSFHPLLTKFVEEVTATVM